jgi:hypothetical protein
MRSSRAPPGSNVANRLVINLQPKDGLELHLLAQGGPGEPAPCAQPSLAPVQLDLDFDKRFGSERVGAYERLLLDVIDGRLNLFVRSDEQEEAWRWVEPILDTGATTARAAALCRRHLGAERFERDDRARRLLLVGGMLSPCSTASRRPALAGPRRAARGRLVLADPRAFANLPVSELAERAHVSKPTVVRFCRSMGYDGLSDFKLKLAGSVSEGVPFIHRSVDADDKTGDVMVKVIDNTVAAFLKYRNDAAPSRSRRPPTALAATYKTGAASSSTASAIRASWRRTRSTSSSAWA